MNICISYADQNNPSVFEWTSDEDGGYGDVIITDPADIFVHMCPAEMIKILRKQFPDLCVKIAASHPPSKRDTSWRQLCPEMFTALETMCLPFSQYQPTEQEEYVTMATTNPTAAKPATAAPKPATAPKEKKAPAPRKYGPDDTIVFAADKSGKKYGPDNNPKRVGSASHKLWSVYKEGQKVSEYLKSGGTAAAIAWDTEHGYITLKKPV